MGNGFSGGSTRTRGERVGANDELSRMKMMMMCQATINVT